MRIIKRSFEMTEQARPQIAHKYANKSYTAWIVALLLVALFPSGIYAANRIFFTPAVSQNTPIRVYDATAAREAAIVSSNAPVVVHVKVYDATAAREAAIQGANEQTRVQPIVYDATAAMLAAQTPQKIVTPSSIGNVYDATGAMLDAIVFPVYP
jgi:hypothetical protein